MNNGTSTSIIPFKSFSKIVNNLCTISYIFELQKATFVQSNQDNVFLIFQVSLKRQLICINMLKLACMTYKKN